MNEQAANELDWVAVVNAHRLESQDASEWLRYGIALLNTIESGPKQIKQQQQAALALEQAKRVGATEIDVKEAQLRATLIIVQLALLLAEMDPTAQDLHQWLNARQAWNQLRGKVCNSLVQGDCSRAYELIRTRTPSMPSQTPNGVREEIWDELLLNACLVLEPRLPALKLVETRSLPRSGHHFLRNLLQKACGEFFSYCEGYQEPGCCKRSPCSVSSYWHYAREHCTPHLRLLKSHDFKLTDSTFSPPDRMARLIQVRKPLELLGSWLELAQLSLNRELLQEANISLERIFLYHEVEVLEYAWRTIDSRGSVMSGKQAREWLDEKLIYIQDFLQKWLPISKPFPFDGRAYGGNYVLRYEDLSRTDEILQALELKSPRDNTAPIFFPRHPNPSKRYSKRITSLIEQQLDQLKDADLEIRANLPNLHDGSAIIL